MLKKPCLFLLIFSIVLSISACNTNEILPSETTETTNEPSTTGIDFSNCHPIDKHLASFDNLDDYKSYLQSENYDLPLLEPDFFEAFGTVDKVKIKALNSSDDFHVEYECSYRENDNSDDICVDIYSTSQFQSMLDFFSESAILDASDVSDILPGNVESYWLKTSETEEECADLYAKYYPNGMVPIRYRLSDQVFVYYYVSDFYGIVFVFDDCIVRIQFYGYSSSDYFFLLPDSIVCPATRALLTKSTAPQAAEELYNLWKDALK